MIDLHAHTTASDGTDTPSELVAAAVSAGIETLAITDHDTTAGWDEAANAVRELGIRFTLIPGTEFSCVYVAPDGRRISLHVLGYLYDPTSSALKAERARLRADRLGRGERIVANLVDDGHPISWQRVSEIAAGGVVGRPHIGQALVEAGVVASVNDAFAELLNSDSPYYVAKQDMAVRDAVELIRAAGGVPVIAHPWARARGHILSEAALADLAAYGLLGIEVDHPDHTGDDRTALRRIARELDLLVTGSSDYHGSNKAIRLGAERTSADQLTRLIELASGAEPIRSTVR